MFNRMVGLGLLFLLLVLASPVSGQTPSGARLFPPDTQSFPRIHAYLDVYGGDGGFVHGLNAEDVQHPRGWEPRYPWSSLESCARVSRSYMPSIPARRLQYGIHKACHALTTYSNSLKGWAQARQGSSVDDLSVLITAGPVRTHTTDPAELLSTLESYQPDASGL